MDIVVCFALFLAAMLFCLVKGFSLAWALLFALVLFFALGLRRGYGAKALVKMAWSKMPKSMIVLRILFFIGLLTGLWRSCGTIAFFIYHGIRVITPSLFILVAFLLTVLLSYALGTSFGVASTAGVVLMALARSGGVSEAVTAGVTIAGLIPWCIACAVPLSMLGVGVEALPYACLLYLIPLCYLFTKRFFFPAKSKGSETPV